VKRLTKEAAGTADLKAAFGEEKIDEKR